MNQPQPEQPPAVQGGAPLPGTATVLPIGGGSARSSRLPWVAGLAAVAVLVAGGAGYAMTSGGGSTPAAAPATARTVATPVTATTPATVGSPTSVTTSAAPVGSSTPVTDSTFHATAGGVTVNVGIHHKPKADFDALGQLHEGQTAMEIYATDNNGAYPKTVAQLDSDPAAAGQLPAGVTIHHAAGSYCLQNTSTDGLTQHVSGIGGSVTKGACS